MPVVAVAARLTEPTLADSRFGMVCYEAEQREKTRMKDFSVPKLCTKVQNQGVTEERNSQNRMGEHSEMEKGFLL